MLELQLPPWLPTGPKYPRRRHIVACIASPDKSETVRAGDFDLHIHMTYHTGAGGPYTLLVSHREHLAKTFVDLALKIPDDAIAVDARESTPLEVLEAFLRIYGLMIRIGDEAGTFFLHKDVPLRADFVGDIVSGEPGKGKGIMQCWMKVEEGPPRQVRVAFACSLDLDEYAKSL